MRALTCTLSRLGILRCLTRKNTAKEAAVGYHM